MIAITLKKIKQFRMTKLSLLLLILASYRTFVSGDSIQLVGICAAVVPFICQFRNFPKAENESTINDIFSSYLMNLILMLLYLGWVLLLTWMGQRFNLNYVANPYFVDLMFIAIAADVVFISAVIPVCRDIKPMQRMIPGLILTNALLIFMRMASAWVKAAAPDNIPVIACCFSFLIIILTTGLIFAGNKTKLNA